MSEARLHGPGGRVRDVGAAELVERAHDLGGDVERPFAAPLVAALGDLSKRLLRHASAREAPQLVALGYWLRPASLERLAARARRNAGDDVRVARGLAYQVPPSNVDTLFVYSWALSFLVGNANVTRLPSRLEPVSATLLGELLEVLEAAGQGRRHIFCGFERDGPVGAGLSGAADLRVIWGGDAKVRDVGRDPTRPDGLTIAFPDRKSLAVIDGEAYEALDGDARDALARRLGNDVFWFDQLGCGSPRVVVWVDADDTARHDLLARLDAVARGDGRGAETGVDIAKFVFANEALASGLATRARRRSSALTVVHAPAASSRLLDEAQGGGLLFETRVGAVRDVAALARRELQTVTTFGIDRAERIALAEALGGRGGFRIVPVGDALQFDSVWDGVDLVEHFSRRIVVS